MNIRKIEMGALGLFFVVGAGGYFWSRIEIEQKRASAAVLASERADVIRGLRVENGRFVAERAQLSRPTIEKSTDQSPLTETERVAALSTLAELTERRDIGRNFARPRTAAGVDRNTGLPEGFATTFALNADQLEKLQVAMELIKERVETATLANAKTLVRGDGAFVIETNAGPQLPEWKALLRETFHEVLGADKFSSYEKLSPRGVETMVDAFGGSNLTLVLTRTRTENGEYRYTCVSEKLFSGGGRGAGTASGINRANVVTRLGPLAALLPPDF